eukprot:6614507-Karenia_brevis.AAC.1
MAAAEYADAALRDSSYGKAATRPHTDSASSHGNGHHTKLLPEDLAKAPVLYGDMQEAIGNMSTRISSQIQSCTTAASSNLNALLTESFNEGLA